MLAVFVKSIEVELFVYGTPLIEIVAFGDTVIVGFSEVSETPSGTERYILPPETNELQSDDKDGFEDLLMLKVISSLASDFGSGIIFIESFEQDPMNIAIRTTVRSFKVVLIIGVMGQMLWGYLLISFSTSSTVIGSLFEPNNLHPFGVIKISSSSLMPPKS